MTATKVKGVRMISKANIVYTNTTCWNSACFCGHILYEVKYINEFEFFLK